MTAPATVIAALNAGVSLSALVASRNFGGWFPERVVYPCNLITITAIAPLNTLGNADDLTGLRNVWAQIDSYGNTYDEAWAVSEAVKSALVAASIAFVVQNQFDGNFNPDLGVYRVILDVSLWL